MNFKEWTVEIPHDNESHASRVFADALHSFFSLFSFNSVKHPDCPDLIPDEPKRVIVINSEDATTIRKYLTCLLRAAYADSFKSKTGLENHRYLFIDLGSHSILFEGLRRPLERCGVANTAKFYKLMPAITELISKEPAQTPISSRCLRYAIECTAFPSGAEEMQEILFRDAAVYHLVFNKLENHISNRFAKEKDEAEKKRAVKEVKDAEMPAIRLLLGALAAGDIEKDVVIKALGEIGVNTSGDEVIAAHFNGIENWRKEKIVDDLCHATLSHYLDGRRILLVEDKLTDQHWHIVIPILFGAPCCKLKESAKNQKIGNVLVSHAKTVEAVLHDDFAEDLGKYDIILLDLYSSEHDARASSGHTQAVMRYSIVELCDRLEKRHNKQREEELVPVSFPRVVVFSADRSGLTARTMIKELGASDYFFKSIDAESYKSEYFATFRNTLINALKENLVEILGLPQSSAKQTIDQWLSQFLPAHRPAILRMMKHFRYYSAISIVRAFDNYLKLTHISDTLPNLCNQGKGLLSLFGSGYFKPKRYIFSGLGRSNKSGASALALLSKTEWIKGLHDNPDLKRHDRKEQQPTFTSYESLPEAVLKLYDPNKKIVIVLVDDFIGSGGQVSDYVAKAVNNIINVLMTTWTKTRSNVDAGSLYAEIREGLFADTNPRIAIHVLFAVGIKSKPLIEKGFVSESLSSMSGRMEAGLNDGSTCPFKVHISDAIPDLVSICREEKIDYWPVENLLSEYRFIAGARSKERPCQFEPLGWKDCGGLVALYANAPANTLPIIWADGQEETWHPLFPRFFNPWDDGTPEGSISSCRGVPERCALLIGVQPDCWPDRAKNRAYRIDPEDSCPCWVINPV